jgi:diguanylate cyclase
MSSLAATAHAPDQPGISAWSRLVFGTDPLQRKRIQRSMMATPVYAVWMALELYAASRGIISWQVAALLVAYSVVGLLGIYTLLRSGLSQRLRDASLTLEQEVFAMGAILLAYVLVPPTRSAALQVMCLVLVFGMFTLKPREVVIACYFAVGMLAPTALALWGLQAGQFDALHDGVNTLLACLIMPALTSLIHHFSHKRELLKDQKRELAVALSQVQRLATRDTLTGLFNRHYMTEQMEHFARKTRRSDTPLSVAIIDLDQFKLVNDRFGHLVGDEILKGFSTCAVEVLRQNDVVGRWGGEEFVVLFPDTPAALAGLGLERLRQRLARRDLTAGGLGLKTTFSGGLTQWAPGEPIETVLQRADTALYEAKHQGRDRVLTTTEPQEP